MSKFKVGDVVRVVKQRDDEHNHPKFNNISGLVNRILNRNEHPIEIIVDHEEIGFYEDELELDQSYYNEQRIKKELGIK